MTTICSNVILECIGQFAGLVMKDDRRYKVRTPGTIRIRGNNEKLKAWAPVRKMPNEDEWTEINNLCRDEWDGKVFDWLEEGMRITRFDFEDSFEKLLKLRQIKMKYEYLLDKYAPVVDVMPLAFNLSVIIKKKDPIIRWHPKEQLTMINLDIQYRFLGWKKFLFYVNGPDFYDTLS